MVWAHVPEKLMFNYVAGCCISDKKHKISVSLEGNWVELLKKKGTEGQGCGIAIMDDLQVSLDGVSSAQSKGAKSAALKLVYKEGVVFRRKRKGESRFVNTWQLQQLEAAEAQDPWFATPAIPFPKQTSELLQRGQSNVSPLKEEDTKPEVVELTPSERAQSMASRNAKPNKTREPSPKEESTPADESIVKLESPVEATSTVLEPVSLQPQLPTAEGSHAPPKSKKEAKREKKRLQVAEQVAQVAAASAAKQSLAQQSPQSNVAGPSNAGILQGSSVAAGPAKPAVVDLGRIGLGKIDENTPEGWLAQLRYSQPQYTYSSLKEITKMKLYSLFHVIAIVKNRNSPRITTKGDWSTTVHIQDPSSFEDPDYPPTDLSVVIFQKKFKEWLPQANTGDILIFRNLKVQTTNGFSGVGYSDKMQWAAYSITRGCLLEPDMGDAPESGELVMGGFRFSPFLKGLEAEEHYCKRLAEWWKEKNPLAAETTGQVHQLSFSIPGSSRQPREHRLFCDAGPSVEPEGYLDCTFEVLNGFENENEVYTLYVTDYTKNAQAAICQAPWCPIGLNDRVLLFNLWGAAAALGKTFKPNTFWSVRNARMVCSTNGFVEGKLVETKFSQLDCDDDYPHLQALLERKKEWEKQNPQDLHSFPHKLFQNVRAKEFFNCTVELLHVTKKGPDHMYLDVTDYTIHPELAHPYTGEWSRGLEGRIVRIQLRDSQIGYAEALKEGNFLTITNLRLMPVGDANTLQGELGGYHMLIDRIGDNSSNKDFHALRKRKKGWKNEQDAQINPQLASSANSMIAQLNTTTKELLRARVIARVIDYYPRSPSEWIRAWCSQCKQRVPKGNLACRICQDIDHEFVLHKLEVLLLVEDKAGDRMEIFLRNESNLLQGIDIRDDIFRPSIFAKLSQRLQPLLGTLNEQGDITEKLKRESTFSSLVIGRFQLADLEPVHLLIDVEN